MDRPRTVPSGQGHTQGTSNWAARLPQAGGDRPGRHRRHHRLDAHPALGASPPSALAKSFRSVPLSLT